MTRTLFAGIAIGFLLAMLCKSRKACPEYKVYGEQEVQELETLAKTRRLSR